MKQGNNDFGKRVRFLRLRASLTQAELADKMNFKHRDSVSKIELGKHDVSTKQIEQLADIFGVSVSYLLNGEEETDALSLDDMDLIREFRKAPPHMQKLIRQMLNLSP